MLREKVYIGVDGGGTSTVAIAMTESGKVLGRIVGEQTNYNTSDMDTAKTNLKGTIDKLMDEYGIDDYECLSIGMSSLDYEPTKDFVESFVDGIFPSEKVVMHSDVYMALMGMTLGEPGIMIVSGTGSIGIATDQQGEVHVVGGWGYLLGDEGSGYDIALQGIDAALKSFEGLGETTILEERVLDFFGVDTHRKLIDVFYNPLISTSKLASFGKEVIEVADEGDEVATSIVNKAIKSLVNYTFNLIEKVGSGDCIVGMYGSVLQKNSYISSSFKDQVYTMYPNIRIGFPELEPEAGAALYAMKKRGYSLNKKIIDTIKNTIEKY
jgi:N-acetylglucosamine kinase-like BadF-type ATPase